MFVQRTAECSFVMHDVPWATYASLDRARGESSRPRLVYLDGKLEIIVPGDDHEFWKMMLARYVFAYAEELDLDLNGLGSATRRDREQQVGLEPDEWFFIGALDRVPDLAIEISASRSGVSKLESYSRLRVPEVWLFERSEIEVYRFVKNSYVRRDRSVVVRGIDLVDLAHRVVHTERRGQIASVRRYRDWLRQQRRKR